MVTEPLLQNFYLHIHKAADSLQDVYDGPRHTPSPSGITACRLRQWFQGKGVERTNRIPVDSLKNMEQGTAIEGFWRDTYQAAGFHVAPAPPVTVGDMRSRGGDGILYVATEECAKAYGLPKGTPSLLELKNFGAWSYFDFIDNGIEKGHPDYWAQVQSYMHGYGLDYCIFHAGMADPSGTKWLWKRIKKRSEDIPPFWIEIIRRDPSVALETIDRAAEIRWAIDKIDNRIPVELRDYDPHALLPDKKFPCFYCGWAAACVGAKSNILPFPEAPNATP
jgi:hypothetical protein